MKTTQFITPKANDLHDPEREREHGPDNALESYTRQGGNGFGDTLEILCTTDERADFERETKKSIDADELAPELFDALRDYLVEDVGFATADKYTLAGEFVAVLTDWLSPEQRKEVVMRNVVHMANGHRSVCASHDFCDANMAMEEAFRRAFGREERITQSDIFTEYQCDADISLWNSAWTVAKALFPISWK